MRKFEDENIFEDMNFEKNTVFAEIQEKTKNDTMQKIVIRVENVHKSFKLYSDKAVTIKERLLFKKRRSFERREVLKGISFTVNKGETVGLIGQNGCGKSTLLKLLTRILYPDKGTVTMVGRVSSLLELGAGFHPDLSGRENIYANAAIFGLKKKEVDSRLQDIIDFSGLEEYIDNPVRTYSSGMYTRLAFSVAINVDADILLIDEILAVGDVNFQIKCLKRMRQLRDSGVTIIFVSHDGNTVKNFCTRAIWINSGEIAADGDVVVTVDKYFSYMNEQQRINEQRIAARDEAQAQAQPQQMDENGEASEDGQTGEPSAKIEEETEIDDGNHYGSGDTIITGAYFVNAKGERISTLESGAETTLEIYYRIQKRSSGYNFGMGVYSSTNQLIYGTNTNIDDIYPKKIPDVGCVRFKMNKLPLLRGEYKLTVAIVDEDQQPLDYYRIYSEFNVSAKCNAIGFSMVEHEWIVP